MAEIPVETRTEDCVPSPSVTSANGSPASPEPANAAWEAFLHQRNQNPTAKAWRTHCEDVKDGYAWNLSILNRSSVAGLEFEHRIVDFHEVFTVPREFLESLLAARVRDRPRLLSPYREHLSQAFARYFMRVGLPIPVDIACSPLSATDHGAWAGK